MKGQVSIEFLIVFVIFFSILIISIVSLINVKNKGDQSLEEQRTRLAAEEIANTINNICILGNGNSRNLYVNINNYSLEMPTDRTLRLKYKNISVAKEVNCIFNEGIYSNSLIISCCDQGKITIE
ncbi:hypothetical protein KO317_00890 [Candidatus Micrarchaeota archaeon]|nr:hypothetical protein [Candidatus Micrarchaeota archaeon]